MRLREFITLIGGMAASWPLAAGAQQTARIARIGLLVGSADNPEGRSRVAAFRQTLQMLGWTQGRNAQIDLRWGAADAQRTETLAKEIVGLQPDVIFAETTPVVAALLRESRTIPIVFVNVSDPVGSGFVDSLAHPGGLVTGFISNEPSLAGKWLQLLKEAAPAVKRAALLYNPQTAPYAEPFMDVFKTAGALSSVEAVAARVHDVADLENTIVALAREPDSGMVVMAEIFTTVHQERIVTLAAQNRLATVYPFGFFARNGGLMSYGVDIDDLFRRAASYVDRILGAAKPSDLPVQAPTKFQLIVNLKTAKTLGLTIPPSLLVRADEVIE
jgi:putative ABC transport system substrate-binding protein